MSVSTPSAHGTEEWANVCAQAYRRTHAGRDGIARLLRLGLEDGHVAVLWRVGKGLRIVKWLRQLLHLPSLQAVLFFLQRTCVSS